MKKHVLMALRVLIAIAGIGYIGYSLTWSDHVVLPSSPDAEAYAPGVEPGQMLPVVSGRLEGDKIRTPVVVRLPNGSPLELQPEVFGEAPDQAHFRPGILATLRQADLGLLGLGLALVALIYPIQTVRWWLLMRARRLDVGLWQAFRLMMVGCFFNYCMPGTTGGDVVKAYYAARGTERRADAVMSVVFDRIAGLLGLLLLGGLVGLTMLHDPIARVVTFWVWGGFLAFALGSSVYFSRRLRVRLGVNRLIGRLPFKGLFQAIDGAAVAYRDHKMAIFISVLMSIGVHLILCISAAFAGFALGMDRPMGLLLTVLPILFLAAAAPLTYQGLGVMEGLAMAMLLSPPEATANHLVGMLLMVRLFQVFYSMGGAIFVLRGDIHMQPAVEEAAPAAVA